MSDDGERGRFVLDLPDPDAALALAGEAETTLHRLEALTGASMVLRGLQLVITGRPTQIERAAAVVELVRPIWQDGQSVSPVDLQSALGALNTGRGDDHADDKSHAPPYDHDNHDHAIEHFATSCLELNDRNTRAVCLMKTCGFEQKSDATSERKHKLRITARSRTVHNLECSHYHSSPLFYPDHF